MSRDPAKSRPLSANVLRLMRLSRASPKNSQVVKYGRSVAIPDFASCSKQGNVYARFGQKHSQTNTSKTVRQDDPGDGCGLQVPKRIGAIRR